VVVNAAGVWSDEVGGLEDAGRRAGGCAPTIRPAKGVHLTVHRSRLPATSAAVLPVAADGRSIFVIPWPGTDRVYVGTTDTDYRGDVDHARCTAADVAYLLAAVNPSLTDPLSPADVVGCWAGLRPLVAGGAGVGGGRTADLSRRHRLSESDRGVVTITGGKLTTYRRMAADTVDRVATILGAGARSRTATLRLRGAPASGLGPVAASRYGTESGGVGALVAADPSLGEPLVAGLPYLRAEVVHAVRHEMARTLEDVLDRRLRARILARDAAAAAASDVAALVGPELGWSRTESDANVAAYRAGLDAERMAAGLPPGSGDEQLVHRSTG
jgi:glycerol-3-phosphate dehydrogenase